MSPKGISFKSTTDFQFPKYQLARRNIVTIADSKQAMMGRAKAELLDTKRITKELAFEVKPRVRERTEKKDFDWMKKCGGGEGQRILKNDAIGNNEMKVVREAVATKQEVNNLKLVMADAVAEKKKAEEEIEALRLRMESYLRFIDELEYEIQVANEEHVLVELARIEANKELKEIESQRKADAEQFSRKMKESKSRICYLVQEVKCAEGLEMKLAATNSDIDVLQHEMIFVRAMGKNLMRNNSPAHESKKKKKIIIEERHPIVTVKAELEASKKELASLKEEGFQLMSSMDIVREEMMLFSNDISRMKKLEEKADITIQNLKSKLTMAKSKLESASQADRKSKSILSNLLETMERLRSDTREAMKEKEKMIAETKSLNLETEKTDSDNDKIKGFLLSAVEELEAVKLSEALALDELKTLSERVKNHRSTPVQLKPTITISCHEYEYLREHAGVKELVDKKLEAAEAWIAALTTSAKETLLQVEMMEKEIREIKELEENQFQTLEEALASQIGEKCKKRQVEKVFEASESQFKVTGRRKSFRENDTAFSSSVSKTHHRTWSSGKAVIPETEEQSYTTEIDEEDQVVNLQIIMTPPRRIFKRTGIKSSRRSMVYRRASLSRKSILSPNS